MSYAVPNGEVQQYAKRLSRVFESLIKNAQNASSIAEFQKVLENFSFNPDLQRMINKLTWQMVSKRQTSTAASWREAASQKMNGGAIRQFLKTEMQGPIGTLVRNLSKEFANDISSLPLEAAREATADILEWVQQGIRPEEIAKRIGKSDMLDMIQKNVSTRLSKAELARFEREGTTKEDINRYLKAKHERAVKNRINTIARTEASRASEALQEARCEQLDIKAYYWRIADDERTRSSHRAMNGVICLWSEPPAPDKGKKPYHAGGTYNCRCYAEPIVSLDSLPSSPLKVWHNEAVRIMTKQQLLKLLSV